MLIVRNGGNCHKCEQERVSQAEKVKMESIKGKIVKGSERKIMAKQWQDVYKDRSSNRVSG